MSDIFEQREAADYGTALVKYNAATWDAETRMLYLIGRKPDKYLDKYKDTPEWKAFLALKNVSGSEPLETLSATASRELATRILSDDMIEKLSANIIGTIKANPQKEFSSIRVAVPFPIDETATSNTFAPTLAAAVTAALEARMPAVLEASGIKPMKIIAELDATQTSREEAILNIVNNQRGNTSNPVKGEEVAMYMQRVVRQPVYTGKVDPDALYVPVDDFLVSQSTVAGLMNYIQAGGGTTTRAFCGVKLFDGTEVLAPQQATLNLLNLAIETGVDAGRKKKIQNGINRVLNSAGLNIDFENVSRTTLSNIELLFVAGYFADGQNTAHQQAFTDALKAVGGTVEQTKGNSAHDIFNSPPGTLKGLGEIFEWTLDERLMLVNEADKRFQDLIATGRTKSYQRGARI